MNDFNSTLVAHCGARKVNREHLKELPVPESTRTHQPLSHFEIVSVLEEALSFRYLRVVRDEYAVSPDGMKMFGVMDLNAEFNGCRFSIGLRNSNDKTMRFALTVGYRVFVCDNMAFSGDFTPLLHKHSRNLDLQDSVSIAVDRIHRGFKPLEQKINQMRELELSENEARLIIYKAFLDRNVKGIPRHFMPMVHDLYFEPSYEAFRPRNFWSLSNAFTSAFKKLAPIKQFEVTAKFGSFLTNVQESLINRQTKQSGQVKQFPKLEETTQPKAPAFNNVSAAIQFGKLNQNLPINNNNYPDIDDDDFPSNPYDDELFNEYFDQAEAEQDIDEATERLVEEYEQRVA